jgi:hypothetical protein
MERIINESNSNSNSFNHSPNRVHTPTGEIVFFWKMGRNKYIVLQILNQRTY